MVRHDGATVVERSWAPWTADDRALVYSASKTFAATAVGLAIGEGRFALADRLVDLLGEDASPRVDDRVAQLTVHHVLSMSTGHTEDTLPAVTAGPPREWASRFLSLRPQQEPGSCHVYNNGASFVLGELVRRHTGEDLREYLQPRLLQPLGIDATWDRDPIGRCLGWSGMHLRTRDLAAMGELLRCDGVWRGERLLPEGWVARATSRQIPTGSDEPAGSEWTFGYGYQVWMGREGYRLDGAYGQFAFVLPERGLVVAIQSAQSCTQALVDLLWEHLEPAPQGTDSSPGLPDATRDPAQQGAALASSIPLPPDSGRGDQWTAVGPVPLDPTLVDDGEEVGPPADLADLRVERVGDGFRLTAVAEGYPATLAAVPGEWRRQVLDLGGDAVPVALAAGADASGDLHVRIAFTDTPHTLRLRLAHDGGGAQAWRVNPLQGPSLAAMRARPEPAR